MEIKTKYNIGDEVYEVWQSGERWVHKFTIGGVVYDEDGVSYIDNRGCYSTEWHTANESSLYTSEQEASKEAVRQKRALRKIKVERVVIYDYVR